MLHIKVIRENNFIFGFQFFQFPVFGFLFFCLACLNKDDCDTRPEKNLTTFG